MSVKLIVDPSNRKMWRVYDKDATEILLIVMQDGELLFYKPLEEEYE